MRLAVVAASPRKPERISASSEARRRSVQMTRAAASRKLSSRMHALDDEFRDAYSGHGAGGVASVGCRRDEAPVCAEIRWGCRGIRELTLRRG